MPLDPKKLVAKDYKNIERVICDRTNFTFSDITYIQNEQEEYTLSSLFKFDCEVLHFIHQNEMRVRYFMNPDMVVGIQHNNSKANFFGKKVTDRIDL